MGIEDTNEKDNVVEASTHLIIFRLGTEEYGFRIEQVKEVTLTPKIARMPKTPAFIKGVANIRGDIIAIMDLEERFNISKTNSEDLSGSTYTLVIEAKEYTLGLTVRDMPQSLSVPVSRIDRTPTLLQDVNIHQNYIEGIAKLENRLIILLDIYKILTQLEVDELQQQV